MDTIIQFIVSRKKLVLVGLVLLLLALWLLIPKQIDKERLQSLYDRGHYQAVRDGATQVLARNPGAHEYREFLIQLELDIGNWDQALEHTCHLYEASWPIRNLEAQLSRARKDIAADAVQNAFVLDVLERELPQHRDWNWLKLFGLELLRTSGAVDKAPGVLSALSQEDINNYQHRVMNIWNDLILDSDNLEAAWLAATALDEKGIFWWQESRHILFSDFDCSPQDWLLLQEDYPDDPSLAAIRCRVMSTGGLDWLRSWEEGRRFEGMVTEMYISLKMQAVAEAQQVHAEHLRYLAPKDILWAGLMDIANRDKLEFVLNYVQDVPELVEDVEFLRQALASFRQPSWSFPLEDHVEYSLRGDWLGSWDWQFFNPQEEVYSCYNLVTGESLTLPGRARSWSPHGTHVALLAGGLRVYNSQGHLVLEEVDIPVSPMHQPGWRDEGVLWVPLLDYSSYEELDMGTLTMGGVYTSVRNIPPIPLGATIHYGPEGKVAWQGDATLNVYDGKDVHSLPLTPGHTIAAWSPDGSAVILSPQPILEMPTLSSYGSFGFGRPLYYEIGGSAVGLDLPASRPKAISWLTDYELTWSFPLVTGQSMLGIYNLETEEVTMTGIVNSIEVSGRRVLAQGIDKVYVYELD